VVRVSFLFWLLYGSYLLLNVLDGLTTWIIIRPDKFHREANPLARWLFVKMGIPRGIIIVEGVVLSLLTLVIFWLRGHNPLLSYILLGIGDLIFMWIVVGSFGLMSKLKQREQGK